MEPRIDYAREAPVPQHKTVALVNHFVTQTVRFLNQFAALSEERLQRVTARLHRAEVAAALLEEKLGSIGWLAAAAAAAAPAAASSAATAAATAATAAAVPAAGDAAAAELPPAVPQHDAAGAAGAADAAAPPPADVLKICDHPDYAVYFKMLRFGVPEGSVKNKMEREGFRPEALDTPDAPAAEFLAGK